MGRCAAGITALAGSLRRRLLRRSALCEYLYGNHNRIYLYRCGLRARRDSLMLFSGPGVVEWVESQLAAQYAANAVGIGWRRRGRFVAGLVFEGYNGANIFVHIAKLRGEPMPVDLIAAMFDYPFRQLGLRRMSAMIADRNKESKRFAKRSEEHTSELQSQSNLVCRLL